MNREIFKTKAKLFVLQQSNLSYRTKEQSDISGDESPDENDRHGRGMERTRGKPRPPWNNRLAKQAPIPDNKPKITSWKRFEAELTHMPEVTTNEQVSNPKKNFTSYLTTRACRT